MTETLEGRDPLVGFHDVIEARGLDRLDHSGRNPGRGLAMEEAALDEVDNLLFDLGRRPGDLVLELGQGPVDHFAEREAVAAVEADVDDAQGLAAQGVGVGAAGGLETDAEAAGDGIELVGDADDGPAVVAGQVAAAAGGQVVFIDPGRDLFVLAGGPGVLPAHDALEIGKFADHAAFEVGLAEQGGAADFVFFAGAQFFGQQLGQGPETFNLFVRGSELGLEDYGL